jgi:hypothetical protein
MPTLPPTQKILFIQPFTYPTPLKLAYKPVFRGSPAPPTYTTLVPSYGGLYLIMIADGTCTPLPYRLIYVGKAGNLSERVCASHEKLPSWKRAAGGAQLFVAFHCMIDESARTTAEQQIIERYRPQCNVALNPNVLTLRALGLYQDESNWPFNL